MSDDLQTVVPESVLVTINDEDIVIKQIRVGQLSRAMRIAHPFYERLKAAKDAAKKSDTPDDYGLDVYTLVMENTEAVLDMVALLVEHDREWVDDLALDDLVVLFMAVVEVNLDFFTQRVLPLLSGLVGGTNAQMASLAKKLAAGQGLSKP